MLSDLQARSKAETNLSKHEGFRDFLYDDANGKRIGPGSHVEGNPTIGYGWALNKRPMRLSHAIRLRTEIVDEVAVELTRRLPWLLRLDVTRLAALYELGYNLGVDGVLGFPKMLAALEAALDSGDYAAVALELLDSKWAREDVGPERSWAISQALLHGDAGPG
jgi:lysozyme